MGGFRRLGLARLTTSALLLVALGSAAPAASYRRQGDAERSVAREETPPPSSTSDLRTIGREVGLSFPSSARLVGVRRENGIDDLTAVKVTLPSSELAAFLATTPVKTETFADGHGGLLGPDDGWWDPGKAAHLRTGQASLPGARSLNIGVADGGAGRSVVYVVNHGT